MKLAAHGRAWLGGMVLIAFGMAAVPRAGRAEEAGPATRAEKSPSDRHAVRDEDYELFRLFADTLDQVERNYVKEIDRRELMEGAIRGMMAKLDPYSNYIPPPELDKFRSSVENEFGGIGITVSTESGQLTIVSPIFGTPAYRAGLRGGDRIVEINGQSTTGISIGEAVQRMKGKLGTSLKLAVKHPGSDDQQVLELTRELVRVDSVLGDRRKPDDRWNYFFDESKKIGYIRITSFSRHTSDDLREAVGELSRAGLRGLVLDLRYNPGGLLTSAIEVSDLFLPEGKIVSTAGRNVKEKVWSAEKEGTFEGFPLAVLVNHYSASASEIVSACLQDHGRAVVIGERTWGKGSVQNIIELEDGKSALKLTTAGYLRPSGKNIHRQEGASESDEWGVSPNEGFEVALTENESTLYLKDRRRRDAIVAHKPPAADDASKTDDAKTDGAKSEDSKPDDSDSDATKTDDKPPAVDRQLQKALDYIVEQLAAKDAKPAAEAKSPAPAAQAPVAEAAQSE